MAKIVLAGRSDCPYFARCELLGDKLVKNLKKFKLHKIVIQPDEWEKWLDQTCTERGWTFEKSPIIWRELIDRGGKGVLIGDANDFQEYAKAYYNVESHMNSYDMMTVGNENKIAKDIFDEEERAFKTLSTPVHICITNASSPVCYYLIGCLCSGQILGPEVEFTLRLLDSSSCDIDHVKGVAMEAEDIACGLLRDIKVFTNPQEAFLDCSYIITLDTFAKQGKDNLKEWIDKYQSHFSNYASIINTTALPTCKVLVSGSGPVNFIAMTITEHAPNLNKKNIVAIASVIENQAKSLIAEKLNVNQAGVTNLIVWGNINGRCHFDLSNCRIHGNEGAVNGPYWYTVNAVEMIHDNKWIQKELPRITLLRYHKVQELYGYSTGISIANGIASTLQNLCRGSPEKQIFSLGVNSEDWYGVQSGLVISLPVMMSSAGCWSVVEDIDINKETRIAIEESVQEINYHILLSLGVSKRVSKGEISFLAADQVNPDLISDSTLPTNISGGDKLVPETQTDVIEDPAAEVPENNLETNTNLAQAEGGSLPTNTLTTFATPDGLSENVDVPSQADTRDNQVLQGDINEPTDAIENDKNEEQDDNEVEVDKEQISDDNEVDKEQIIDDNEVDKEQISDDNEVDKEQIVDDNEVDKEQIVDDNEVDKEQIVDDIEPTEDKLTD